MANLPNRETRQRGAALVMLTMMLTVVVIPMVGLAIDGGMAYLVQTRLSGACDAAVLAGTRALSDGVTAATQIEYAQATISSYLQADFPAGLYGTYGLSVSSSVNETSSKTEIVSVNAVITMPTFFMGIINQPTVTISAAAQTTRRDVNLMLILDRSSSMSAVCSTEIAAAQSFSDQFTNGRDTLGLVTMTATPSLDYAPTTNFKTNSTTLDSELSQMQCAAETGSAHALWLAYQQLQSLNQPSALNVIVFYSDGVPDGISAAFPVKTQTDTRYGVSNPSALQSFPASPCKATTVTGSISQIANNASVGSTVGVFNFATKPISATQDVMLQSQGCSFDSNWYSMRADVAYIPSTDVNGNATTGYQPSITFTSGPYSGRIRPDQPTSITAASQNAADAAATRIRSDTTLKPVIYTIGLGGTNFQPVDETFLERVANDPRSPIYSSSQTAGLFIYASDGSQIANAFNTVASQIMRLSQ